MFCPVNRPINNLHCCPHLVHTSNSLHWFETTQEVLVYPAKSCCLHIQIGSLLGTCRRSRSCCRWANWHWKDMPCTHLIQRAQSIYQRHSLRIPCLQTYQ
jgi:hypothetical protein